MLTGRIVLITGAGSGIGRHLALKFAATQATVIAVDLNETALAGLVDEAGKFGLDMVAAPGDVTDLAALTAIRDRVVREHKRLDVWVNNAGIAATAAFNAMTVAQFDRIMDVNFRALVLGTRLALETMEPQGSGRIVNMASVAGHVPAPLMTAYNASKFAVVGFSRSLSAELRFKDSPVHLTLVSPGFVDTSMVARGAQDGFPEWLGFLLSKPEAVAQEIFDAVATGKNEVFPTFNGKLMRSMYKILPGTTVRSSKLLLVKKWTDLFKAGPGIS